MGDLRSASEASGVWARYDGGKLSGSEGLENQFNTIQIGADTAWGSEVRTGVAASYTTGDTDYSRGSADTDTYSFAAYGTWMADNGFFADVVARYASADTDMTVDGNKTGSLKNAVFGLSAETGWRFDLTDTAYIEPQLEAAYTYVESDNLTLGNAAYDFDSVESVIGRAGFAAGIQCPNNFGSVYVRASVVHEFMGDAKVTGANGSTYSIDGKDTWFEYGIGANFNISRNVYAWADIERTAGAVLDEDWRGTVGVRYMW